MTQIQQANSTFYDHALAFYRALYEAGTDETIRDGEKVVRVFRGKIVQAFRSVGISQAYYTPVRRALIDTGCIVIVTQGARGVKSVVACMKEPVESEVSFQSSEKENLTPKIDLAILSETVRNLQDQIGSIKVVDALLNFENRIEELEGKVRKMEQVPPTPARKSS